LPGGYRRPVEDRGEHAEAIQQGVPSVFRILAQAPSVVSYQRPKFWPFRYTHCHRDAAMLPPGVTNALRGSRAPKHSTGY